MLEIGLAVALFVAIVMSLSVVILAARAGLVASGEVALTINDRTQLTVPVGGTLLGALADDGINLPSTCGAKGTCGLCRVRVLEGGGAIRPVETERITRREAAEGARLACQVVIRQPMKIQVPQEILGVRQWACVVRSNHNVTALIKELVLDLQADEPFEFRAGAFVQIHCPPYRVSFADFEIDPAYHATWEKLNLRRFVSVSTRPAIRAYSMANAPIERDIITLNIRLAIPPPGAPEATPPGIVSSYLFALRPGDGVTLTGPFGHFFAGEGDREMVFIGGGVGMAPMHSHIMEQLRCLSTKRTITFWYGARSREDLFYVDQFDRLQEEFENFRWCVALSEPRPDDTWEGPTGFIHQVVYENYLEDHPAPEECEYYLCGPPVMISAVINMLNGLGVEPESIFYDDFGG